MTCNMDRGRLIVLFTALGLAGCDRTAPTASLATPPVASQTRVAIDQVREPVPVGRVGLELRARGPFRPGAPIAVDIRTVARRRTEKSSVEIYALDEPGAALGTLASPRLIQRTEAGLSRGERRERQATVTFAKPGYYRVYGRVVASADSTDAELAQGDSVITTDESRYLWIVVDSSGGRLTSGFDETVRTATRSPMFGAYGPFRAGRPPKTPSLSRVKIPGAIEKSAMSMTDSSTQHVQVVYQAFGQNVPVPDARVDWNCYVNSGAYTSGSYRTDANGWTTVRCPADTGGFDMNVFLENGTSVQRHYGGAMWYTYYDFWLYPDIGDNTHTVSFAANTPAHAYTRLNELVPRVVSKFGYSRSAITVASDDATSGGSYYNVGGDYIALTIASWTSSAQQSFWVVAHEYGHAFHWVALRPPYLPAGDACQSHQIYNPSNEECAFIEGFADFVASWIYNPELTTSFANDSYSSDNAVEINYWRTGGLATEGAFEGYLYDLVDGSSELDNATNDGKFVETFDNLTVPGYAIATVLKYCQLKLSLGPWVAIGQTRDFIYCSENSVSAQSILGGSGYWPYGYTQVSSGLTGYSSSVIRSLWQYNLFNVVP